MLEKFCRYSDFGLVYNTTEKMTEGKKYRRTGAGEDSLSEEVECSGTELITKKVLQLNPVRK